MVKNMATLPKSHYDDIKGSSKSVGYYAITSWYYIITLTSFTSLNALSNCSFT